MLGTRTSLRGGPSTSRYTVGAGMNFKSYQRTIPNCPYARWNQPKGIPTRTSKGNKAFQNPKLPSNEYTCLRVHPPQLVVTLQNVHTKFLGNKYNTGLSHHFLSHSASEKYSPSTHCQDLSMTKEQATILLEEIQGLQEKSAITYLSGHPGPGFYSSVCCPEKGQRWTPIINLRKLCSFSTLQNGEC